MAKRKGNKKNKRNKLLLLILLLSLSILLLVMSTYAWFTSNTSVSVETLDVNVTTVNGLQISTDAVNWKARVLKTDIVGASTYYSAARNFLPDTLDHMSTAGAVTAGYLDMFHGVVKADDTTGAYILSTTQTRETSRTGSCNGDAECAAVIDQNTGDITQDGILFVAFDLFFKVDAVTPVNLSFTNGNVSQVITTYNSANGEVDNGIKNTVRVAFVKEGQVAPGATSATAQALNAGNLAAGTTSPDVIIWEPNYNTHTQAGRNNATSVYNISEADLNAGNAIAYQGVKAAFPTTANVTIDKANTTYFSSYFQTVNPSIKTVFQQNTDVLFATLQPGVTKYRVYWWVEGQDVDTENGATGQHMKLDLYFAIAS